MDNLPAHLPALRPARDVALLVQHSPFHRPAPPIFVVQGATIADMVGDEALPAMFHDHIRVWVGDYEVPRGLWHLTRPKAGMHVYISVRPMGSGEGKKNILASLLMLVVVAASAAFAGPLVGLIAPNLAGAGLKIATSLVGAGLNLIGGMLVNALVPPPQGDQGLVSQRALLSGVRNQFAPYAEITRVLGKVRTYPLQGARPYTEVIGDDRYIRVLLVVGFGPLNISELKIGETAIGNFANITYQVREGWHSSHAAFGAFPGGVIADTPQTLFTKLVHEDTFTALLDDAIEAPGPWVTRTTQEDTAEISVDIAFSLGLAGFSKRGDATEHTVEVEVEYRPVFTATWLTPVWEGGQEEDGTQTNGKLIGTDSSRTPVSRGGRFIPAAPGQFEVRMRRITPRSMPEKSYAERVDWTTLRSIQNENPILVPGLCTISLRMKATDQFNGLPDTINCVAQSYLPTWNGLAFTWSLQRNPAWAVVDLLRRRGTERMVADSRIDLWTLSAWANACNATAPNEPEPYFRFDAKFEKGSIYTACKQVAAHGRAAFTAVDGLYSVVRDIPQTVPVQHITPRNSWGYSGSKGFMDRPHALRVGFVNAEMGYQDDEVIVYDDGYSAANATLFERMDMPGVTRQGQAWREGRYHLAVGKLRPEEHSVYMDFEQLRATQGDYVFLAHDVLSIGIASARVSQVLISGPNTTGFVIDQEVPVLAGVNYVLRIRRSNGASVLHVLAVASSSSNTTTLMLAAPVLTSGNGAAGDLCVFGNASREVAPMIIKKIEPGPDLTAKITMVDAQPGVWTADSGPIPAFNTNISDDTPVQQRRPSTPTFTVQSDEAMLELMADGSLQDRIGVAVIPPRSSPVPIKGYDVQYRQTGGRDWFGQQATVGVRRVFLSPVQQLRAYDIRVRSISDFGITSNWQELLGHVVVGKTTRPDAVTGFTAQPLVDGVQLTWDANAELDIRGYELRLGDAWDTAALINRRVEGTALFVPLKTSSAQTFLIRAVDAIGLQSIATAEVTGRVIAPGDVKDFDAIYQDDNVQFRWTPIAGSGLRYEIRNGSSWANGRRVARSGGSSKTVRWPVRSGVSRTFWIKALSGPGVYSINARFSRPKILPRPERNIVLDTDFSATTFAGAKVGFTASGTAPATILTQTALANGQSPLVSTLTRRVTLASSFFARNWVDIDYTVASAGSLSWDTATFRWNAAGERTWLGVIEEDSAADVEAMISIEDSTDVGTDLVEGWRLETTLTGINGTTPVSSAGMVFTECRFTNGLNISSSANAAWNMTIPSVFAIFMDFKVASVPGTNRALMTLRNGSTWLRLEWLFATDEFVLRGSDGSTMSLPFELQIGDVLTVMISQSATQRIFCMSSVMNNVQVTLTVAATPLIAFSQIALYDTISSITKFASTNGDLEVRNVARGAAFFLDFVRARKPLQHQAWRLLVPGEYEYTTALILLRAQGSDPSQQVTITEGNHFVDVPDIVQRGEITLTTAAATVTFPVPFKGGVRVVVSQIGGATVGIAKLTAAPTNASFSVRLFTTAGAGLAGDVAWIAQGF